MWPAPVKPFMKASWPHRGRFPRMIAQPAVALHGQYALQAAPGETPPPVQQATWTACPVRAGAPPLGTEGAAR